MVLMTCHDETQRTPKRPSHLGSKSRIKPLKGDGRHTLTGHPPDMPPAPPHHPMGPPWGPAYMPHELAMLGADMDPAVDLKGGLASKTSEYPPWCKSTRLQYV
eukprot:4788862-Amphidinium_carterae.1